MTRMEKPDVIDILDPINNEVLGHCCGPTAQGACPSADCSGIVLCDGCKVAGTGGGPEYWHVYVPPASRHCPRAWNLEAVGY
jgi:hypothetical protein